MLRLLRPTGSSDQAEARSEGPAPALEGGRATDPLGRLAAAARAGDVQAQRTLLVAAGPAMLRVVRGVLGSAHPDVEDTLQDAMVALHLALSGFRGECTTLHFACRIAVQTAMNARRRAGYRIRHTPNHDPEELVDLARDDRSPSDLVLAAERRESFRRLVSELPEPQAEVLALHAVLGYTVEETAAVTAAPVNTVRSRLRNALSKLRERLHADGALSDAIRGEP
jgi:RNA polymerase sigma-70 factor (ECF subfamily)